MNKQNKNSSSNYFLLLLYINCFLLLQEEEEEKKKRTKKEERIRGPKNEDKMIKNKRRMHEIVSHLWIDEDGIVDLSERRWDEDASVDDVKHLNERLVENVQSAAENQIGFVRVGRKYVNQGRE
ncbi:hypothetical protein E2C01_067462 [Portunus trituberculatus]|uniref:Uncharacterized protein n=1 Tax=Portunus trituberculatus TaxID=210409 RepID=A0A5B7HXI2_PORTR|nr:hypothetical protein [Portunus trituberculatus]